MTNKDYSHIRQGMYVLKEEIKDEETWEAVGNAFVGTGEVQDTKYPCNYEYKYFKGDGGRYYGLDDTGDLFLDTDLQDYKEPKQVSVDFILNGPKEEEEGEIKFKVGEVYQCGEVKVKIIYLTEKKRHVVGIELADEGYEIRYVGLWDSLTGDWDCDNYECLCYDLQPIKDNTETLKEIEELKERIKQLEESL